MNSNELSRKELLLNSLKNINRNKHEIKISRSPNLVSLIQGSDVKYITYISIVGDKFIANISSKNQCIFSVFDFDIFYTEQHSLECNGLFKEVYSIIKPLLIIEDFDG